MSRRWYVETTPTGRQQFVSVKRSRSYGHHHHHHHEHETFKVGREEWKRLVERERCLDETNKKLVCEVTALKASLSTAEAEAHHLCHVVVPQLQGQINVLCADNDALRRSADNAGQHSSRHCREEERLKQAIEKLEKEKNDLKKGGDDLKKERDDLKKERDDLKKERDDLKKERDDLKKERDGLKKERDDLKKERDDLKKERDDLKKENTDFREKVKCLSRQVEQGCGRRLSDLLRDVDYWKDECRYWKLKFEDTRQRLDDTCGLLQLRTEKMRAYEEILKRRRII